MKLASIFSRKPKDARAKATDPASAEHWNIAGKNGYAVETSPTGALRQSAVYACVRVLSETIASLPLVLYERNGERKRPAIDFYLYDILHASPNNFMTSVEFWELVVAHLCLRGNAYVFIERDQIGNISRLLPLSPDRIAINVVDKEARIITYDYIDDVGKKVTLSANDVWHVKNMTLDGFVGMSPIQMAQNALALSYHAEQHGIAYFANGARTSGVVELPGVLKPDALDRLRKNLQDSLSGGNKYSIAVFEEGMSWKQISLSNEDSQYLETRNFQIEEIARIFRVPCVLIGHPDKSATYASVEQFMISFVVHTIRPWVTRLERSIDKYLLDDNERTRYFSKFRVDALLRGDTLSRYQAYKIARENKWMTANEIRILEDMDPVPEGDTFENPAIDVTTKKES